jgi:hypothetical protein
MTLNLTPDAEARVRSVAEMRGQDPEDALIALLNQALADAEADLAPPVMSDTETQQVLAALQASVEDYAAGRWISLEDYEAEVGAERAGRGKPGVNPHGRREPGVPAYQSRRHALCTSLPPDAHRPGLAHFVHCA